MTLPFIDKQQDTLPQRRKHLKNNAGVTLVELMITVAISGFVIAAIYMAYSAQQRASFIQDDVAAMQQNARAALSIIKSDLRFAGYNPTGAANVGLDNSSNATLLHFYADITYEDGNVTQENDDIVYELFTDTDLTQSLGRRRNGTASSLESVAEDIEYIDYLWLDENGAATVSTSEVKSITISILTRSSTSDPDYTNNIVYQTARGDNPKTGDVNATATYQDGFRRRMFSGTVACRNLNL